MNGSDQEWSPLIEAVQFGDCMEYLTCFAARIIVYISGE
jgi:hypothetical protein